MVCRASRAARGTLAERPTAELAGHWTALTGHQQAAETRWLAIRDTLARI
ncbi:hypothetical protein [Mycolicibacterium sp. SCSIO 43805]